MSFFMRRSRFWVLGLAAPVFFISAVVIMGSVKPGYSHVYNTISELGEIGPMAQVASLIFITIGIMITMFGFGLHRELGRDDKRVWSGVLVMLYGVLDFIGSGLFPIDPGGASTSQAATIHVYSTLIGELAAVGIPIWFLKDTEGISGWEKHRHFSRIVFWLSLPLIVFLGYCIIGHTPGVFDVPIGLAQRLFVGLFLTWIMVTGYNLGRG